MKASKLSQHWRRRRQSKLSKHKFNLPDFRLGSTFDPRILSLKTKLYTMPTDKTSVPDIIAGMKPWAEGLFKLREILLSAGLQEEVKWGAPTYYCEGKKIIAIGGFKHYFSIWFHQGVFLSDPAGVLVNAGEGKTKGLRQWRFTSSEEIKPALLRKYAQEAIDNAKAGREIKPEKKAPLSIPKELASAFRKDPKLKAAFSALTPGRQREYLEYVHEAKLAATRLARAAKSIPQILAGRGLNEKYR